MNGNYNNLIGESYGNDSRYILAESGKLIDPTSEQIDEEEDELKETSNLMGNSTTLVVSDRKKDVAGKPQVKNMKPPVVVRPPI